MNDKKEVYYSGIIAFLLTAITWIIQLVDSLFLLDLNRVGLQPLDWKGLIGIFTMPLLHSGWQHLTSNTPPLFLLLFGLFFFYKKKAWKILLCLYLVSGLLTWFMGRSLTTHVGASGLIYALAAFHFMSGVMKRVPRQMAFALMVVFLYGGFIWAFFPSLYKNTSISWEGHLSGLITGITFAFYFRKAGPKPPIYKNLLDDDEEDDDEDAYWKIPHQENEKELDT